jgi:L-alanine-DL-glutamate epimerase-like enolase superfamily enzyme
VPGALRIEAETLRLQLREPFTLSYGSTRERRNVLVRVCAGDEVGLGEAALPPYYGETEERVLRQLRALTLPAGPPLEALAAVSGLESLAGRAALEMALHDLWGKAEGRPLHDLWGLDPRRCPRSSFTVAMDADPASYRRRLAAARPFELVKLKLGSGDLEQDLQLVAMASQDLPDAALCVDANGGWSAEEALAIIERLAPYRLAYVEQPVARDDLEGWRRLRAGLFGGGPPLIADESVQGPADLSRLADLVDGVNIKLVKCGGLVPARRMIAIARQRQLRVMIGCMVESSVAVTAAAQLAPAADLADLDGNLLVADDPFSGVRLLPGGAVELPQGPGLGVVSLASGPPRA